MSFLQPIYLYGLIALAIPVIIHLFNFRRTKKVYFSNSKFLSQVKESKSARQRLKHLLVLAARLLFILFLVLAFTQPFIPSEEVEQQKDYVYIYLDNSLSMGNEVVSNLRALDYGIQSIERIISGYPKETQFRLLTNDFSTPIRAYRSKDEIRDLVTEIELIGVHRSFDEVLKRLGSDIPNISADWYFISDFQKSTFTDLQLFTPDSLHRYFLIPVLYNSVANVFIDSVYLRNPFLIASDQNTVEIQMRNTGSQEIRDLVVGLIIEDRQIANAGIDIPAEGSATTTINLNFPLEGSNAARLSFEEFPVAFDNDFYFNLNLSQRISIMEISDQGDNTVISKVYANQRLFEFKSYSVNNLDYNVIGQANLIVVNALDRIPQSLIIALKEFRDAGGSLLLIPDSQTPVADLSSLAEFADIRSLADTSWVSLETPEFNHPFFSNIFEEQGEQPITMPRVKNTIQWSGQRGDNLLLTKNGLPYLSTDYRGTIYLVASSMDINTSSMPQHALFVPIMYKIAALSKAFDKPLYYITDQQVISLDLDSLAGGELFNLDNGTQQIVPNQRIVGNELFLEIPSDIINPGFYQLKSQDREVAMIPYNHDRRESILAQYNYSELDNLLDFPSVRIMDENEFERYSNRVIEARSGIPLWKYCVLLALVFLAVEVLLIRFLK